MPQCLIILPDLANDLGNCCTPFMPPAVNVEQTRGINLPNTFRILGLSDTVMSHSDHSGKADKSYTTLPTSYKARFHLPNNGTIHLGTGS